MKGATFARLTAGEGLPFPLRNLMILSYAVAPERLRPFVPPPFELDTRIVEPGREVAYVSAVIFENHSVPALMLPWPRLTFGQANYRIYVRWGGTAAVDAR
jgi:uncharacterized protein YqjF (DUF2071 family)